MDYQKTTKRLQQAVKKRDDLNTRKGVLQGRLQAAQDRLKTIVSSCEELGIEPTDLQTKLKELEAKYEQSVSSLEESLELAESKINPYE